MNKKRLDDLTSEVTSLFIKIQQSHVEAYHSCKPQVEDLIKIRSKDVNNIERLLDYLLDHCSSARVLKLFKELCCYYWDIDTRATAGYIRIYKEHWKGDHSTFE
jgi:ribosomal protein L17